MQEEQLKSQQLKQAKNTQITHKKAEKEVQRNKKQKGTNRNKCIKHDN